MGYTLTIGELQIGYFNDNGDPHIALSARQERHKKAPAFGEPTDYTNTRWPSYTVWTEFTEFAGLYSLFFAENREDRLIYSHPGCVPLTEQHRQEVNQAFEAFKLKYPNAVSTYGNTDNPLDVDPENPEENGYMCRLVWLHYWVNWALDNCEKPVFGNS